MPCITGDKGSIKKCNFVNFFFYTPYIFPCIFAAQCHSVLQTKDAWFGIYDPKETFGIGYFIIHLIPDASGLYLLYVNTRLDYIYLI